MEAGLKKWSARVQKCWNLQLGTTVSEDSTSASFALFLYVGSEPQGLETAT